jgi:Transposase IS66 family
LSTAQPREIGPGFCLKNRSECNQLQIRSRLVRFQMVTSADGIALFDALHRQHRAGDAILYAFDCWGSTARTSGRCTRQAQGQAGARTRRRWAGHGAAASSARGRSSERPRIARKCRCRAHSRHRRLPPGPHCATAGAPFGAVGGLGARPIPEGKKELVGFQTGVRESAQSWRFGIWRLGRFLGKHRVTVDSFYKRLDGESSASEVTEKFVERLQKNRNKMFTFLDFDGIPWNNNNAEHAIKTFALLRRVIEGKSTEKSLRHFLILLSICETCKYKNVDFLDFLRSESRDIDDFAASQWRQRLRWQY